MKVDNFELENIKKGYYFDENKKCFVCVLCQNEFTVGEIFKIDDKFYDAEAAVKNHIKNEHGSVFSFLLENDAKELFTDTQRQLLEYIESGKSDSEIAQLMNINKPTIRQLKFRFRQKARNAKLYLAAYETAFENAKCAPDETLIDLPDINTVMDERFMITGSEKQTILNTVFESLEPLKLKYFPVKEKKKIVILMRIANQFVKNKDYTEKEVNAIIKEIFDDYVTIRRYLIEYGFMSRTNDCSKYWMN